MRKLATPNGAVKLNQLTSIDAEIQEAKNINDLAEIVQLYATDNPKPKLGRSAGEIQYCEKPKRKTHDTCI
ncbi:TPA: hypothetical protein ACVO4S_002719 [Vibrio diabolicus]